MLKELYTKEQDSFTKTKCVLGIWRDTLDAENQETFDASMANVDFSILRLLHLYKAAGATFGATAVRNHRNGICRCN